MIADIFLGKIKAWDDAAIKQLNPGVSLPSTPIAVIHRSDGSGTTFNFTDYLSHVSPEWKQKVGTSTSVQLADGAGRQGQLGSLGRPGENERRHRVHRRRLRAREPLPLRLRPEPSGQVRRALAPVDHRRRSERRRPSRPTTRVSIVDPPASAASAYPISTYTYAIVPQSSPKAATLKDFLTYAIGPGQQFGPKLLFASLPQQILARDKQTIAKIGS